MAATTTSRGKTEIDGERVDQLVADLRAAFDADDGRNGARNWRDWAISRAASGPGI